VEDTVWPQTLWWLGLKDNGQPLHVPLALASLAVIAALTLPVVVVAILLIPAALPLLSIAPVLVIASLPWWLHLPTTGKPLLIPLFLFFVPVVVVLGILSLCMLPVVLLTLLPILCVLPMVLAFALPLLFFCHTGLAIPALSYVPIPAFLAFNWPRFNIVPSFLSRKDL